MAPAGPNPVSGRRLLKDQGSELGFRGSQRGQREDLNPDLPAIELVLPPPCCSVGREVSCLPGLLSWGGGTGVLGSSSPDPRIGATSAQCRQQMSRGPVRGPQSESGPG